MGAGGGAWGRSGGVGQWCGSSAHDVSQIEVRSFLDFGFYLFEFALLDRCAFSLEAAWLSVQKGKTWQHQFIEISALLARIQNTNVVETSAVLGSVLGFVLLPLQRYALSRAGQNPPILLKYPRFSVLCLCVKILPLERVGSVQNGRMPLHVSKLVSWLSAL